MYIYFTTGEYEYQYIVEWEEVSSNKKAINKKGPDFITSKKNTQSVPISTASSVYFLYSFVDHKSG